MYIIIDFLSFKKQFSVQTFAEHEMQDSWMNSKKSKRVAAPFVMSQKAVIPLPG